MPDDRDTTPTPGQLRRAMRLRRYCHPGWILGRTTDPVPVEAPLRSLIRKLGMTEQVWFAQLLSAWAEIVGAPVAAHARPGRFNRGKLTVFVDSSVWLSELNRNRRQMLEAINRRFAQVKEIALMVDAGPP